MSQRPLVRSPDLRRLLDDGYTIELVGGLLVVGDVPWVDNDKTVHEDGRLVMPLTLSGDVAQPPGNHTAHFVGGVPCDSNGAPLSNIINNTRSQRLADGLVASCMFSAKPRGGRYTDFHQKVTMHIAQISAPAEALRAEVTARRHRPVATEQDDGPFNYVDTASSRAGIDAINDRVRGERLAIIGLGGTGAYVLDLIAKTPVAQIHLFDDDPFLTHNAFRAPGAPTLEQLGEAPPKVEYLVAIYSNMHRGIVAHTCRVDGTTIDELRQLELTFAFVCVDDGDARKGIFETLDELGVPFTDVGMGVDEIDGKLTGIVRTTTSTPERRDHVATWVPFGTSGDGEYQSNVQIAELNALNATLAVIRWKKLRGFYADLEQEHHSLYAINGNHIANEERA